jgi:quercetin dioxygenase-like cupin family protein
MSAHVADLLPELALGTLAPKERADVESHVRACPLCADELRAHERALAELAFALPAVAPDPKVKAHLRAQIRGRSRFAPFIDRIARLFDLAVDRAEALLETLDDAANWMPGPCGGNELYFVPTGPRLQGAEAGFIRLAPGAQFPRHRHIGEETTLVLAGGLREDGTGQTLRAGDPEWSRPAGSLHSFVVLPEGVTYAVVIRGGLDFFPDANPGGNGRAG